jgi:hypothetical protein
MKSWNPDASERFEVWLGRVRRSVTADPSVDADDITQDLRAHVHAELEALPEPVTVGALDRVLEGLGNPSQWTDTAEPIAAGTRRQRVRRRLNYYADNLGELVTESQRALAGEWGLPVVLAVLTLTSFFVDAGLMLFAFTYFVARAQFRFAPGRLTGRTKWLMSIPLAIGAGVLAGLVLAFPAILNFGNSGHYTTSHWRVQIQTLWALGLWWIVLGVLTMREPKRVQSALRPFADSFEPSHGRFLAYVGAALLIFSTVMLM